MIPRQEVGVAGQGNVHFRKSLYLGHTSLTSTDVGELVRTMGKDYNGNVYHIFDKYVLSISVYFHVSSDDKVDPLDMFSTFFPIEN